MRNKSLITLLVALFAVPLWAADRATLPDFSRLIISGLPDLVQVKPAPDKNIPVPIPIPVAPDVPVSLPPTLRIKTGQLAKLTATSKSEVAFYFPPELAAESEYSQHGNEIIFPPRPGTWRIVALVNGDKKPYVSNVCVLTIEGNLPPVPPGPTPPGPIPADFHAALEAALKADGPNDNAKALIISVYRLASEKPEQKNVGQLLDDVATAADKATKSALPQTRAAMQAELVKRFPSDRDATLDLGNRASCSKDLNDLATILESFKPTPPTPPPSPAPIPAPGFRALVIYETADLAKMPRGQTEILSNREVRNYLDTKTVKGSNGAAEWRIFDQNIDVANESEIWRKAMTRPRQSLPWLLLSDGQRGFEGPLPENVPKMLELLKRYAEPNN